jgi:hypothetical protein
MNTQLKSLAWTVLAVVIAMVAYNKIKAYIPGA